jgi:hypothetical protein
MLREDVVNAVRAGRFHVHPVSTVDEGIALLSGRPAGEPDAEERYPEGSFNAAIEAALDANVERLRRPPAHRAALSLGRGHMKRVVICGAASSSG